MDHMGGMGSMGGTGYGYSLDTFLGGLLILLVKLLMVVLVIAVIVGVGVWIKNTFFKNTTVNTQFIQTINKDPILKTISVVTLAILGIILIFALLGSFTNPGMGYGIGGHGMGGYGYGGFSAALSIGGLLNLLIKVLSFVLVISLILALFAYIKKQYDQGVFNFGSTNTQNTQGGTVNVQPGQEDTSKNQTK